MNTKKKRALFIDRDGTLVVEPPVDYQLDSLEKLQFMPKVFRNMAYIREKLDFELVMVTNQDGLGTPSFPEDTFWPAHNKMLQAFEGEGVMFDAVYIDRSFPEENLPTRKPGTAMLISYLDGSYDMSASFVIGDRLTDMQLARNLGCKGILYGSESMREMLDASGLGETCALITDDWDRITEFLFAGERRAEVRRTTAETDIYVSLNLDGNGRSDISTGIGFFDHMLDQIARHSGMDLAVHCKGDLYVDEHHTIEDTGIALGEAIARALGDKRGIERYGFCLPMDDCLCTVALDFGGRPWLVWNAVFYREKVGDMPTEMFLHFFKSLSDSARMNLTVKAEGENEHHKIEGIFKAFARSLKMALHRDIYVSLNLDGNGRSDISTGIGFFDHMLDQIARHSGMDLAVHCKGDLYVDEHHTIEDTGIALGEAIARALGDKRGIERYGFCLPMDDCLCTVALDFGGRPWLVWNAVFYREKVGDMPTEMFLHFFKSLSDSARMNLTVKAEGENEHHKIEGIFKAFARSLKMALHRDIFHYELPSTKGVL